MAKKLTKKTKILIIVLSVVAALGIVIGIICAVLFKEPAKPKAEGCIYQTGSIDNGMAGYSYISFDYVTQPEQKEEGKLYGNVFTLWCSYAGSGGYQNWLEGNWELVENKDGTFGNLTLTGEWADGATTYLDGAESGAAKVYEPNDGKYTIPVQIGGQGVKNIMLDPVADKKGETTEKPNDSGDEEEANLQLTLKATAAQGQISALGKIECYDNNTWKLSISYTDETAYIETASGTWAMEGYTAIVLTVSKDEANVLADETYNIVVTAADQTHIRYNFAMACTVPQVGALNFEFSSSNLQLTMEAPANAATQSAKIDIYTDGTWTLSLSYYQGGAYTPSVHGTWEMQGYTGMILTVTVDTADIVDQDTYTVAFDTTTTPGSIIYSTSIKCVVSAASLNDTFNFAAILPIAA